jgi:UDP-glucuronate decarboxylase
MHLEKRVLVTGGAGFLGSFLCERLLADGAVVLCLDNFFTGARRNIEHLLDHPRFELLRHDVTFPLYVEVDEIFNLACPASPVHYQHDPVQTTKTSVHGAINMLGLAKRVRARILQASTSEVYGDPLVHPQKEDYWGNVNPIGARSCYDEGKRCAETLFFDYWRQHKLSIKVARIFNTYGPRMHPNDGRVVSNFIVQALLGRDLTVFGDGSQTRSFCYVDDMIAATRGFHGDARERDRPRQYGQPRRIQHSRDSQHRHRAHQFALTHRTPGKPNGRSETAAARYLAGATVVRMGPAYRIERRAPTDDKLFRSAIGATRRSGILRRRPKCGVMRTVIRCWGC